MKRIFLNAIMTLILVAAVSACSDYDAYGDASMSYEQTLQEYNENFITRFGQPDPNHSWGFNTKYVAATRAADANAVPNNAACNLDIDDINVPTIPSTPGDAVDLSNLPSDFHSWDCTVNGSYPTALVVPAGKSISTVINNSQMPFAIDIYVAGTLNIDHANVVWQRTPNIYVLESGTVNYNIDTPFPSNLTLVNKGKLNINIDNFTIQQNAKIYTNKDVSVKTLKNEGFLYVDGSIFTTSLDANQTSEFYTTGDLTVRNGKALFGSKGYVGGNMTCGTFQPYENSTTHIIGNLELTDDESGIGTNSSSLCVEGTFKGKSVKIDCKANIHVGCKMYCNTQLNIHNECTLVTNYVYAPETRITQGTVLLPHNGYADLGDFYIEDVSTSRFRSTGTATINCKKLVIGEQYSIGGEFTDNNEPVIDGFNIFYNSLYIHWNTEVSEFGNGASAGNCLTNKIDGYNAIDPGDGCEHKPNPNISIPGADLVESETKRVMCEDLGNDNDFDFNDLVFDATWPVGNDKHSVKVLVLAAGGTIPIYLGGNDVHARFGVPSSQPINVNATRGADNLEPIEFTIPISSTKEYTSWAEAVLDIPILVGRNGSGGLVKLDLTNTGDTKAPRAFALPTTVKWTQESRQINIAYGLFDKWVGKESNHANWYNTVTNSELLYGNALTYGDNNQAQPEDNTDNTPNEPSEDENDADDNNPNSGTENLQPTAEFSLSVSTTQNKVTYNYTEFNIGYKMSCASSPVIDKNASYTLTFQGGSNYYWDSVVLRTAEYVNDQFTVVKEFEQYQTDYQKIFIKRAIITGEQMQDILDGKTYIVMPNQPDNPITFTISVKKQ